MSRLPAGRKPSGLLSDVQRKAALTEPVRQLAPPRLRRSPPAILLNPPATAAAEPPKARLQRLSRSMPRRSGGDARDNEPNGAPRTGRPQALSSRFSIAVLFRLPRRTFGLQDIGYPDRIADSAGAFAIDSDSLSFDSFAGPPPSCPFARSVPCRRVTISASFRFRSVPKAPNWADDLRFRHRNGDAMASGSVRVTPFLRAVDRSAPGSIRPRAGPRGAHGRPIVETKGSIRVHRRRQAGAAP